MKTKLSSLVILFALLFINSAYANDFQYTLADNDTTIVFSKNFNDSMAFIPDGPTCIEGEPYACISLPITVNTFSSAATIQNADDLISVCLRIEHSFIGDIGIELICPSGASVNLKTFNPNAPISYLGLPYGGNNHGDPLYENSIQCTSPPNVPGLGYNYCFSNVYTNNQRGILNSCPTVTASEPTHLANNCITCDSTSRADSSGYYLPDAGGIAGSFNGMIGCPLNGEWKIKVCDYAIVDNGFMFSWDLELKGEKLSSINEVKNDISFSIYPNPAKNNVNIKINGINEDVMANIYDVSGRLIMQKNLNPTNNQIDNNLDVSKLAKGIYTVSIQNERINKTQKLVIE